MTIALGVLGGNGIVLGADSEETVGEAKTFALKLHSGAAYGLNGERPSAMAVTGAGYGPYLDCVFQRFTDFFGNNEQLNVEEIGAEFQKILYGFYAEHVIPYSDSAGLDFQIIVGAQRDGQSRLWVSNRGVMRRSYGYEAVGLGDSQAKAVLIRSVSLHSLDQIAALACYAILRAKENVVGCGKNTLLLYLTNNSAHHVYPDVIDRTEELFRKYEGWENSSLLYAVGYDFVNEPKYLRRMRRMHKELRQEFSKLFAQMLKDRHG
jgi:20S proteasome alpha/beta subunit